MPSWSSLESSLPQSRAYGAAAAHGNFLYVVGGSAEVAAPFSTFRNQILRARIAGNGKLGQWQVVAVLAENKLSPGLFISGTGIMYVIGGTDGGTTGANFSSGQEVLWGQLNSDGDIVGALKVGSPLPVAVDGGGIASSRDYLYVIGGLAQSLSLDYDGQDGNFAIGEVVTGASSGAVGTIFHVDDSGATGTIGLDTISGTFSSGEYLHGSISGRARAAGVLGDVLLDYGSGADPFGVGNSLYGMDSGAEAVIVTDSGGPTGTLALSDVVGSFQDSENLRVKTTNADVNGGTQYSRLDYVAQVSPFTVAATVTGGTSGATATIFQDVNGGATGTLYLTDITGTFQDGENITDGSGGDATTDGVTSGPWVDFDAVDADFEVAGLVRGTGVDATIEEMAGSVPSISLRLSSISGAFIDNAPVIGISAVRALVVGTQYQNIDYDSQTGAFAAGETVEGRTSSATLQVLDPGANSGSGTMTADSASGSFSSGEVLVGSRLGSASADGNSEVVAVVNTAIYRAKINSDGSLGNWVNAGLAPAASNPSNHAMAAVDDTLYLLSDGVLYWAKNSVIGLGPWQHISAPALTTDSSVLAIGDRIIILGGAVSGTDVGTVRALQIGGDGAPTGLWYRTADMPVKLSRLAAAASGNRIYVCGGRATAAAGSAVLMAQVLDGFIGGEKI